MDSGGMVAVVQGLHDSGLTVTLLDGGKQYTLTPETAPHPASPRRHPPVNTSSQHCTDEKRTSHRENGVQATDGRYASTYKMVHCNCIPTSPPQNVTEFPPQRAEIRYGHGNFVVGGLGSGPNNCQALKTDRYRGAMCWPDRGSVCASRPSVQPDAFANSLRRYPACSSMSPERSSEIVERLINFTQAKNQSKNQNRFSCSPTRNSQDSHLSKQTYLLERCTKNSEVKANYVPDIVIANRKSKTSNRPTREECRSVSEGNEGGGKFFYRSNDVRCVRDATRQIKDGMRQSELRQNNQMDSFVSPILKERIDYRYQKIVDQSSNNSVNMEIQASAQMESKEMLTLPRIVPMQRTVATLLTPVISIETISKDDLTPAGSHWDLRHTSSCKSIQVKMESVEASGKTLSSVQLHNIYFKNKRKTRSRSDEELSGDKKNVKQEILKLLHDLSTNDDEVHNYNRYNRKSRVCHECKQNVLNKSNDNQLGRTISDNGYVDDDFHINSMHNEPNKHLKHIVKKCMKIKACELVEKGINKEQLMQILLNKLKMIANSAMCNKRSTSNNDVVDKSDDTPNEIEKTSDVSVNNVTERKRWEKQKSYICFDKDNTRERHAHQACSSNSTVMTHKELRNLIDLDILAFTEKYRVNISTEELNELRDELFDLLAIDLKNVSFNRGYTRKKIEDVLQNRGFSELQVEYLTDVLTDHWSEECSANINSASYTKTPVNVKSDTFIIFPNLTNNSPRFRQSIDSSFKEPEYSINEVSQKDIDANVNTYVKQLSKEINDWLLELQIPQTKDAALINAIISDLANDIVDRHKYLELNPSSEISDASELENLKYQIFKWIYKLVGDVDMTPVEHATDLMQRIQKIPVPTFSKQHKNISVDKKSSDRKNSDPLAPKINVIEPSNLGASSTRRFSSPNNVCCKRPTCKRNKEALSKSSSARFSSLREPEGAKQISSSTRRMSSPAKFSNKTSECNNNRQTSQLQVTPEDNVDIINQHPISVGTSDDVPRDRNGNFSGGIKIKDDEDENRNILSQQQHSIAPGLSDPSVEQINAEYDQYLKDWVQSLPIPIASVGDERQAEEARLGIYNDIWGVIVKLSSDPAAVNNRFFYEDLIDAEIERLLSTLPQSEELVSKKHLLKVKLIEKTSQTNERVKASILSSYKQQLLDSVKGNLPKPNTAENQDAELLKLYEELQVLNLVEDFIVYTRYQTEDKAMAEAYRKKLMKRAEAFVEELKENHGMALRNIDKGLYLNNMLNTLKQVPIPSDETMQREAEEILLGVEIEKWFTDLPLIPNDDYTEQLQRRRLRNNLARKILEIEKGADETDYTLKNEVSQFLGKAPLQRGEGRNINFMVDELVKRLKNRPKSIGNDSRKVGFHEPNYEEFSRNMPLCSSYIEKPNGDTRLKRNVFSNQSIHGTGPSHRSHNGHFHSIPRPNEEPLSSNCCDPIASFENAPHYTDFEGSRPISSSFKEQPPDWFTLRDSHELTRRSIRERQTGYNGYSQPAPLTPQRYVRQDYHPEELVELEPQRYMEQVPMKYAVPQRPNVSLPHRRISPRMPYERRSLPAWGRNQDERRMAKPFVDQEIPDYDSRPQSSPKRHESFRVNESMRPDGVDSPPRFAPRLPSPRGLVEYEDTEIDQHSQAQMNQSGVFFKSTDQEGIRRIIDRNKSMAADRSTQEHRPSYQPPVFLPHGTPKMSSGYVMPEDGTNKRYTDLEDSDEDEEDEVRCRCIEKMWRSKKRHPRYCPLEGYEYPMCLSTPYFYPYFY